MTPAILAARKHNLEFFIHDYEHDTRSTNYGLEACQKLDVPASQMFKTLIVDDDGGKLIAAVLPVAHQLSLKALAKTLGLKRVVLADADAVQTSTGYVLGAVSPLGQKNQPTTVIDISAQDFATIYVSAGRRGLELELSPKDLITLTSAKVADISHSGFDANMNHGQ